MYTRMNEDLAWERLKDVQREAENRRLLRDAVLPAGGRAAARLAGRAWVRFGVALRRAALRREATPEEAEPETIRFVA